MNQAHAPAEPLPGATRQQGQALVETAVTLPILLVLFLGFLAVGVAAQAYVDLNTAVNLAAASEATAPSLDQNDAMAFRNDTFNGTINHFPQLTNAQITCTDVNTATGVQWAAGATISCTGTAQFTLRGTPMEIVIPIPPPPFSATATANRSQYRSEKV